MSMPQVTNTTSFGDAVKILKNKGIIAETVIKESEVLSQAAQDENKQSKAGEIADLKAEIQALMDSSSQQDPEIVSDKIDDIKAKIEKLKAEKEKAMYANTDPNITDLINELSEVKSVNDSGKQEYKQFSEAENDNLNELIDGITIEHKLSPTKTYNEIVKIVLKNLKKDPFYYTTYKLTGIAGSKIETMDTSKPEDHQMKYYTGKNAVDTAREMKKVKMPKKVDEKKKLKENVEEEAMRFKDLPADPEKYKMVKDIKGKIIKATNADGVEFQRGDVVKAFDGEKIKIVDFKEEQGKVKALYNKGMFFATIDIDGLNAPKPTMRPGVDMGKSFEKFKSKLSEMVKKAMAEMYDGRDNLDAENELEEGYYEDIEGYTSVSDNGTGFKDNDKVKSKLGQEGFVYDVLKSKEGKALVVVKFQKNGMTTISKYGEGFSDINDISK
jgi:hypothetical protein